MGLKTRLVGLSRRVTGEDRGPAVSLSRLGWRLLCVLVLVSALPESHRGRAFQQLTLRYDQIERIVRNTACTLHACQIS